MPDYTINGKIIRLDGDPVSVKRTLLTIAKGEGRIIGGPSAGPAQRLLFPVTHEINEILESVGGGRPGSSTGALFELGLVVNGVVAVTRKARWGGTQIDAQGNDTFHEINIHTADDEIRQKLSDKRLRSLDFGYRAATGGQLLVAMAGNVDCEDGAHVYAFHGLSIPVLEYSSVVAGGVNFGGFLPSAFGFHSFVFQVVKVIFESIGYHLRDDNQLLQDPLLKRMVLMFAGGESIDYETPAIPTSEFVVPQDTKVGDLFQFYQPFALTGVADLQGYYDSSDQSLNFPVRSLYTIKGKLKVRYPVETDIHFGLWSNINRTNPQNPTQLIVNRWLPFREESSRVDPAANEYRIVEFDINIEYIPLVNNEKLFFGWVRWLRRLDTSGQGVPQYAPPLGTPTVTILSGELQIDDVGVFNKNFTFDPAKVLPDTDCATTLGAIGDAADLLFVFDHAEKKVDVKPLLKQLPLAGRPLIDGFIDFANLPEPIVTIKVTGTVRRQRINPDGEYLSLGWTKDDTSGAAQRANDDTPDGEVGVALLRFSDEEVTPSTYRVPAYKRVQLGLFGGQDLPARLADMDVSNTATEEDAEPKGFEVYVSSGDPVLALVYDLDKENDIFSIAPMPNHTVSQAAPATPVGRYAGHHYQADFASRDTSIPEIKTDHPGLAELCYRPRQAFYNSGEKLTGAGTANVAMLLIQKPGATVRLLWPSGKHEDCVLTSFTAKGDRQVTAFTVWTARYVSPLPIEHRTSNALSFDPKAYSK
jgi:hypothetical protein